MCSPAYSLPLARFIPNPELSICAFLCGLYRGSIVHTDIRVNTQTVLQNLEDKISIGQGNYLMRTLTEQRVRVDGTSDIGIVHDDGPLVDAIGGCSSHGRWAWKGRNELECERGSGGGDKGTGRVAVTGLNYVSLFGAICTLTAKVTLQPREDSNRAVLGLRRCVQVLFFCSCGPKNCLLGRLTSKLVLVTTTTVANHCNS